MNAASAAHDAACSALRRDPSDSFARIVRAVCLAARRRGDPELAELAWILAGRLDPFPW